jgi:cellulose synthase/poly-beta-1,6-N-acetylglucosamine synthase-like glycosyltransferase
MQAHDWKVRMCVPSRVYTVAPSKIKEWIKQRNRWNMGGLQTIIKYRKAIFKKKGMLGAFILPFFILSWLLGLFGITILGYRLVREIVVNYLSTKYSIGAQTAILTLREINLTPHVLIFLGLVLFLFGLFFTLIALSNVREKQYKRIGVFTLGFYLIFYLLAYPIILIISLTKFLKRKRAW